VSLRLRELCARRGDFSLRLPCWDTAAGELAAVLGTNGAGKSTLFGVLCGDVRCAGRIELHGRGLQDWPRAARARHLGVLLQQASLSFAFTAEEVVALGLTPLSVGWREGRQRVRALMRRTDTAHLAQRAYPTLSGGERQRVNLARVLLQLSEAESAPLLLLDEPTSAQDLGHQHQLMTLARDLAVAQGFNVVAVLHDLNLALAYADQCLVLAKGEVAALGKPRDVLKPARVEAVWGYRPRVFEHGGDAVLA
jgi:iron complex transport system ATP-binding protein